MPWMPGDHASWSHVTFSSYRMKKYFYRMKTLYQIISSENYFYWMKIFFVSNKNIFYRIKIFYQMKLYFYRIRIFLSNENIFLSNENIFLSNENNFYRMQIYFYRMKIIFIEFCYILATIQWRLSLLFKKMPEDTNISIHWQPKLWWNPLTWMTQLIVWRLWKKVISCTRSWTVSGGLPAWKQESGYQILRKLFRAHPKTIEQLSCRLPKDRSLLSRHLEFPELAQMIRLSFRLQSNPPRFCHKAECTEKGCYSVWSAGFSQSFCHQS